MIENNKYCLEHRENKVLNICLANHTCQRKFCYECYHNQGITSENFILVSEFPNFVVKNLKLLNNASNEKTSQLRIIITQFKQQLELLGQQFQKHLNESLAQISEILFELEQGDQNYQRLLNFYLKPTEISQIDLELIINAIKQNKLEKWSIDKESLRRPILEIKENVYSYLNDFKQTIKEQFKTLNQLKEEVQQNKNKNWQQGIVQVMGMQYHFNQYFLDQQFQKTQFFVEYKNSGDVIYIKDGVILKTQERKDERKDHIKSFNVIRNLDQLKYLEWIQQQISGKWFAIYSGEDFISGGYQNDKQQKFGKWIDLFENFHRGSQTFYEGQYNNGIKEGVWQILLKENIIGCGVFDNNGEKNGLWVDLHQNFSNQCQVQYLGQYQNGTKIGKWQTFSKNELIGGGSYNNKGNKIGKWITLHENFQDLCNITYSGEYRGRKFGKWDTIYENEIIGGGFYDQKGIKDGKWIELNETFYIFCYIIYEGNYKGGRKQGVWNIFTKEDQLEKIGEGFYNQNGVKHGKWIEPDCNYFQGAKILYMGEYDNGIKKGVWVTNHQIQSGNNFIQIGCGVYDEDGIKVGYWKELKENFCSNYQVVYEGVYKFGKKQNRWNKMYKRLDEDQFQLIGGGEYDENGMKHGLWIDLTKQFSGFNTFRRKNYNHGQKEYIYIRECEEKKQEIS